MPSCSARGCNNKSGQRLKVTFHLFPKNTETRQLWVPVTGRKNWIPGKRAVLCSDHFEEPCFDRTGQTTRLRVGAIPTKGKFAPKNKKFQQQIFIKQEPDAEPTLTTPTQPTNKNGMTTRSGRQLSGRMAAVIAALKKDPSEEREIETLEPDVPSSDLRSSTYPDHFYCRTSKEMESMLRKSENRVEFLKKKLDYLSTTPNTIVKTEPPPDWSKFNRASLQKEAEIIKASLKDGAPLVDPINTKDLLDKDEQIREKIKEAQEIRKQIKTAQQRNRRIKKRSKAKFFRYVVMIEPTKEGKKASATCTPIRNKNENRQEEEEEEENDDGEKEMMENEEESIKEESQPTVNQVSSIHESILSHTASMLLGPKDLSLNKNNEKQIKDLERKLKIAKLKEKRKTEQIQHLYEVIEMLKERWPEYEYTTRKEHTSQRRCSFCHSFLLKRCNQIADSWDISNITEDLTLPLKSPKQHSCHVSKNPSNGIGVHFCSNCQKWGKSNMVSQRRSLVCKLSPLC